MNSYFILITLCVIVILAYTFDITAKYTRIPGVILLIITGMVIFYLTKYFKISIPDLSGLLPLMGTLGLILIVLDGSLDLTINTNKRKLIEGSISSAIFLLITFIILFTLAFHFLFHYPVKECLLNGITLGIISSAVAIPSASGLKKTDREFVTYESSFSDILGILAFDFILANHDSIGQGIAGFLFDFLITVLISVIFSLGLGFILNKISHQVKYVIIMAVIILVYSLAKLIHMPSLLVVFIFGLILNNNHFFRNKHIDKLFDFKTFNAELHSFKHITGELTFLVRSFFFIMFGFYTSIQDLLNFNNLAISVLITSTIFLLRGLYLKFILKIPLNPLLFFAPRGLITILLFLSIPESMLLPFVNKGVVTQVIFLTILMTPFGHMFLGKVGITLVPEADMIKPENPPNDSGDQS